MSGVPGRSLRCNLYRYPLEKSALRTSISGFVFLARMPDIISLRFSADTMSVTVFPVRPDFALCRKAARTHGSNHQSEARQSQIPLL